MFPKTILILTFLSAGFIPKPFLPFYFILLNMGFLLATLLVKKEETLSTFGQTLFLSLTYTLFSPLLALNLLLFLQIGIPLREKLKKGKETLLIKRPRITLQDFLILLFFVLLAYISATAIFKTIYHPNRLIIALWYSTIANLFLWGMDQFYKEKGTKSDLFLLISLFPLLYAVVLSDQKIHLLFSLDLAIKGLFVCGLFTALFFFLDMIPKQRILLALLIQYVLFSFFGSKAYTVLVTYFFFQTALHLFSGEKSEKTYEYAEKRIQLGEYLLPVLCLILMMILSNNNYAKYWPVFVTLFFFPLSTSFIDRIWGKRIKPGLLKMRTPQWGLIPIQFLVLNILIFVFLLVLSIFSSFNMRSFLLPLITLNTILFLYHLFGKTISSRLPAPFEVDSQMGKTIFTLGTAVVFLFLKQTLTKLL